jgi:hypothetical protein
VERKDSDNASPFTYMQAADTSSMQQHLTVILPPQSFHHHSTLGHLASTQYLYFVLIALSCAITLSIRFCELLLLLVSAGR